jgi:FtsZ-binding cell division protein ZapB
MISVEQVRALEERVEKAVAYIAALKSENAALRRELDSAQAEAGRASARAAELEASAEAYRHDQASIEEGIMHALKKLDAFEDLVLKVESSSKPQAQPETAEQPQARPQQHANAPANLKTSPNPPIAHDATPLPPQPAPHVSPVAPTPAAPAHQESDEPDQGRSIDELSLEELEAATAPEPQSESPQAAEPVENELDIF